jgi:hypothetical protein
VLAKVPGNNATVDEALATTEGSPAAIIAGKLTNEPPPAMAFIAPANRPAPASRARSCMTASCATFPNGSMGHSSAQTEVRGLDY